MLSHGADIIVVILVVVEVRLVEGILPERLMLFLVKPVVLYIAHHLFHLHVLIVLLRAISRVCGDALGLLPMSFLVLIQERLEGQGVCWIVIKGEVRPILILCRNLKVIGWLCLPIVHGIFLETHEGRIGIGLGVTVFLAQYIQ